MQIAEVDMVMVTTMIMMVILVTSTLSGDDDVRMLVISGTL